MEKTPKERIAAIIRGNREAHSLSQSNFALTISALLPKHVTKQDVSKWENGRTAPEYWLVYVLCITKNEQQWVTRMANEIFDIMKK